MATRTREPWFGNADYLESWVEQLEESFILDEITDDRRKVAAFLSNVGRYGYEILKNLVTPKKPSESKYDELTKMLKDHVNPKPVVMVERHRFAKQCQGNKIVTQFLADLRKAAEHCHFGNFYEEALWDRFICWLTDVSNRKALLSEDKSLELKDAFSKALAREQAAAKSRVVTNGESESNFVKTQQKGAAKLQRKLYAQNSGKSAAVETCKFCKLNINRSKCTKNQCKTSCFYVGKLGTRKSFVLRIHKILVVIAYRLMNLSLQLTLLILF
jgi:hypothetical protein